MSSKGSNLSGGQKQRILIARALAAHPDILLLNDSSSALDYKTDAALRGELKAHFTDTTVIIVAQRIRSVKHADHILVLDNGKMIGYGRHDELMNCCEIYREISQSQMGVVFLYASLMVGFYLISSVLSYLLSILMIAISRKVTRKMRKDVFARLMELPVGYFDLHQTGEIISKISYDIDTVNESLSSNLIQVLTTIITVTGAFAMMLLLSPLLLLVFVVTVPLSIVLTKFLTGKTRPLFRARSQKLGELNGLVAELISGMKTLRAYTQEKNTIHKFRIKNTETVEAYYQAEYYGSVVGPSVNFINNLSLSLISVFGSLIFLAGRLLIGNISSFVLYSRKFSGPINEAANIMYDLQSALAAAERGFQLIDEPPEPIDDKDAAVLENVRGEVSLSHVNFAYTTNVPIIHNLSLRSELGRLIAIVGSTGAGKTTLINLLMRFYDVNGGTITG